MPKQRITVPGERLFPADDEHKSGDGTYVVHGHIYASLAGFLHVLDEKKEGEENEVKTIEVRRENRQRHTIPFNGAIVTAKITIITNRYCKCSILAVERSPLTHSFAGQIRKEDIRATGKDKTQVHLCYRPGDTILARVIGSQNDSQSSFLLSTAEDELGVVVGIGNDGEEMVPMKNWKEIMNAKTGVKEPRKIAKIPRLCNS